MIAVLCAALVAASTSSASPAVSPASVGPGSVSPVAEVGSARAAKRSALASAYGRELALLESEKAALVAALEKVRAQRTERAAGERKAIASLEAALVAVRAENEGAAVRIANSQKRGAVDEEGLAVALGSLRRSLGGAGLDDAARAATLPEILDATVAELTRGSEVRRVASGFFSADGTFVNGTIVDLGRIASVGASATAGGPLAILDDVRQVSDDGYAAVAQRFVDGAGPAPVRLSPAPAAVDAAASSSPWSIALPAVFALLAGLGLARWLRLRGARRQTARAVSRTRTLIAEGDGVTARAVASAAPAPAGALLSSIVEASMSPAPRGPSRASELAQALDDVAAEAWLDAAGAVDRGDRRLVAAALGLSFAAAAACVHAGTGADMKVALEVSLALGAVVVGVLAGARGEAAALKRELERAALNLVDAVRSAREVG